MQQKLGREEPGNVGSITDKEYIKHRCSWLHRQ